jgi:hypothetical protein
MNSDVKCCQLSSYLHESRIMNLNVERPFYNSTDILNNPFFNSNLMFSCTATICFLTG